MTPHVGQERRSGNAPGRELLSPMKRVEMLNLPWRFKFNGVGDELQRRVSWRALPENWNRKLGEPGQQSLEFLERQRPAEQVALEQVAI